MSLFDFVLLLRCPRVVSPFCRFVVCLSDCLYIYFVVSLRVCFLGFVAYLFICLFDDLLPCLFLCLVCVALLLWRFVVTLFCFLGLVVAPFRRCVVALLCCVVDLLLSVRCLFICCVFLNVFVMAGVFYVLLICRSVVLVVLLLFCCFVVVFVWLSVAVLLFWCFVCVVCCC